MVEHALYVAAASYDSVDAALRDYDAVLALDREIDTGHELDAAVIARKPDGKIDIVKKHEDPTRHGASHGLKWGLAAGAVVALFPVIGVFGALAMGGSAGAVLGALSGHVQGGLGRDDLKELGDVLDQGQAGLVVVYTDSLADAVTTAMASASKWLAKPSRMAAEDLNQEVSDAAGTA